MYAQQTAGSKIMAEVIASSSSAVVKGAPFSAKGVNESVQILADGNKITRSYTVLMYRDSEGRFRREGNGNSAGFAEPVGFGNVTAALGTFNSISIFDPVENVRYYLTPSTKTVRQVSLQGGKLLTTVSGKEQLAEKLSRAEIELKAASVSTLVIAESTSSQNSSKKESLGTRNFEGVEAEGTRTVTTFPAGSIGNERDIEIVYERWYSKELQLVVFSRHSDPRFGEQTYRLTEINRNEPDPSLFSIPSDYKILSEPAFKISTTKPTQ